MGNKKILITGASSEIGRSIAVNLSDGNTLFITGRNTDELSITQNVVEEAGGKAIIIQADLSNKDEVEKLIIRVKENTDGLDILINVAGVWHDDTTAFSSTNILDFSQDIIINTFMVGIIAPTLLVSGLTPIMKQNSKIINISGTFENGGSGWIPYFVSKRAIEDFTVALSDELKEKDIQVNCVSPSDTRTQAYMKFFPQYINEAMEPEKIGIFIKRLCSDEFKSATGKVYVIKKDEEPFEKFHS